MTSKQSLNRNPLVLGIAAGTPWFLAHTVVSYLRRGEWDLIEAVVGGLLFGIVSSVFFMGSIKRETRKASNWKPW